MLKTRMLCKFPITFLQDKLYGISTSDLIIFACDSGVGKSTLSRMVMRQAHRDGCPAVLYSLENAPDTFVTEAVMLNYCADTKEKLDIRQFAMMHTANPDRFKQYRQRVFDWCEEKSADGLQLSVVHEQVAKGDWNVKRLIESMRAEIARGYRLFVIDHLDVLVQNDELQDTKLAMDELWNLVQQYELAIVTFSQIVKGCNALCPSYDDLRGHKAKVYKSTIIITLGRHEYGYYHAPVIAPSAKPTYIRIAKSRSTSTGCAVCYFNGGSYLDDYTEVLCDTPGDFIDGMTREKLRKFKQAQEQKAKQWD